MSRDMYICRESIPEGLVDPESSDGLQSGVGEWRAGQGLWNIGSGTRCMFGGSTEGQGHGGIGR